MNGCGCCGIMGTEIDRVSPEKEPIGMNYIVLDLEWNQTYFPKNMIKEPVLLRGEIVQIGAVKLNDGFRVVDTFKAMVAPKYYKKMHKRVSKLTGITTGQLQEGQPFPVVFEQFKAWCGQPCVFLTWGPDDINMLRDNVLLHALDAQWLPDTYNVQIIFGDQILRERRQMALTDAMELLHQPALVAHDALNDARNTACICGCLDMEKGLAEYQTLSRQPKARNTHREEGADGHDSPLACWDAPGTYPTKAAALGDPALLRFECPGCGKAVTCEGLVRQNYDKYIGMGKCEDGNELFIRFKFKKQEDGSCRVTRILWEMDKTNRQLYQRVKKAGRRGFWKAKNKRRA